MVKAISTYVATVILVVATVGIGVSLFLYFSGYLSGMYGGAERRQQVVVECAGARLDVDYYRSGTNLIVLATNIGSVDLRGNFSIRVEHSGGVLTLFNTTSVLRVGEVLTHTVTGLTTGTRVTRVVVTPLGNCPIPFTKVKEVVI